MNEAEKIIAELKKLDSRIQQAIEKILGKNPSKDQLLKFVNSKEFDQMLNGLGLRDILSRYMNSFNIIFLDRASGFQSVDLTATQIKRITNNLDIIKNSNGRTVLGYFQFKTEELKKDLTNSIINGQSFEATREAFGKKIIGTPNPAGAFYQGKLHHFTDANVGTVINTSYQDYAKTITSEVFKDNPGQRYEYVGELKPTSSDECEWMIHNQDPKGYTRAEIEAGLKTPYIYAYGDFKGQTKIINWYGRVPNFNCPHEWMPVDPTGLPKKKTDKSEAWENMIEDIKKSV